MKRYFSAALLILLTVVSASAQSFNAQLSGASEVPGPGDPDGTGVAVVTISGTTVRYAIFVQNIVAPTAAHVHRGAAGTSGPVVVDLGTGFNISGGIGDITATQAIVNEIVANPSGFYVNVHNPEFPGGAIRGQLVVSGTNTAGARTFYLPVVGKVAGAAGTNFVTDLRIVNSGSAVASVSLDFFASSASGHTAPTATRTITIAPGEQRVLDDLLGATLSISGLGALRVRADQDVIVTSRVINDLRGSNQGTTGFSVKALELSEARQSGTLSFLSQAPSSDIGVGVGFRTNIGYFNPNTTPVMVTFTARRTSDGAVIATSTVSVAPLSQVQQGAFSLISNAAAGDEVQPNFYVSWVASAPLFVYAAVVDNRTGDAVFVQQ